MKKVSYLILLGICSQVSAADFIYGNNHTDGTTLVNPDSWYDYATFTGSSKFMQLNTTPGSSDNVFIKGYTLSGSTDDGDDGFGGGTPRSLYLPNRSIVLGGDMSVNNFTIDIPAGYNFNNGTHDIAYINGAPGGTPANLTVAGTLTNTSSHEVVFDNTFNNIQIGALSHTGTGTLKFSSGIKNLYLGTDTAGVSTGVQSTIGTGKFEFNVQAGSNFYVGKLTANSVLTVNGAGDTYFNDTYVNTSGGNNFFKGDNGLVYFKDYTSNGGFVMYQGTLSADSFHGNILGRGGNWTNLNLYSTTSNYGDTSNTMNWDNVTITGANGQFFHYAGKVNAVSDVLFTGGVNYLIGFGGGGNYTNPANHSVASGDMTFEDGSGFHMRGGAYTGGTITIKNNGSFRMYAEDVNPGGELPPVRESGNFTGNVIMNQGNNLRFSLEAGNFSGNVTVANNATPSGSDDPHTFIMTGGTLTGAGGSKAQVNISNAKFGIFRGGSLYGDVNFEGDQFITNGGAGGLSTNFVSGSTITSKASHFGFRPDTGDTVFDGVMNLSGNGAIISGESLIWIRSSTGDVYVKELNVNGGFAAGRTLDNMSFVDAAANITLDKVAINLDDNARQYLSFRAGANGSLAATSEINIGSFTINGAADFATANVEGVEGYKAFGSRLQAADHVNSPISKISVGSLTGTGYITEGTQTGFLIRGAENYEFGDINFTHAFGVNQAEDMRAGTKTKMANVTLVNTSSNASEINVRALDITGKVYLKNNRSTAGASSLTIRGRDYLNINQIEFGGGSNGWLEELVLDSSEGNIYVKDIQMTGHSNTNFFLNGAVAAGGNSNVKVDNFNANAGTVFVTGYGSGSRSFDIGALTGGGARFIVLGDNFGDTVFTIGNNTNNTYVFSGTFDAKGHSAGNSSKFTLVKTGKSKQVMNGSKNNFAGGVFVNEGHLAFRTHEKTDATLDGGILSAVVNNFAVETLTYNEGSLFFELNNFYFGFDFDSTSDFIMGASASFGADDFMFSNMANFATDEPLNRAVLFNFDDKGSLIAELAALVGVDAEFIDVETHDLFLGTFGYDDTTGEFYINFVLIPEPSTYAAIFGLLALALAVYRRRK